MASMHDLVRANKRNTWVLIFVFVLLIGALGLLIGALVGRGEWTSGLIGAAAAGLVAFFMVLLGFFEGDRMILGMSGARQIQHDDNPKLFNVVEEMSIASGIPMPKVYVINDSAPNAFATGRDPEHASVAITTGLLDKLSRDEVQGVMAHEMSHVKNYDIKFAMLMAILVGTVVLICDVFLRSLRHLRLSGGRSRGKGGGLVVLVLLLVTIIFAIIAPILAKIIQLAVSRQREYLADASAAELTRYPEGLASALEKIQGDREPLEVANRATQHLYIVNPIMKLKGRKGTSMWSTHPPIDERVRRLREMK
ncbi:MAG TPA: M48 family metallopeptidase [Planctomycetota bacterium]|nr:M48 family metallopeptidase [Planctomycetota bacterium]